MKQVNLPPAQQHRARGLENLSQTCYLNAAVQFLRACKPFRDTVVMTPFQDQNDSNKESLNLSEALSKTILEVENTTANGSFKATDLEQALLAIKTQ